MKSEPPTTHPELVLMLLADARLPASGHTQSGGLEPALANGLSPGEIAGYCQTRLRTVTLVEAAVAVVARHYVLVGKSLDEVEDAWAARTPSDALRRASLATGAGYRRLALRLWSGHPAVSLLGTRPATTRACVVGVIAAASGLSAAQTIRLVGYDDVQTVLAAALKLAPFDPAVATQFVMATYDDIERLVVPLQDLTEPDDIPAPSAPLIESWAQTHAHTPRRLFSA